MALAAGAGKVWGIDITSNGSYCDSRIQRIDPIIWILVATISQTYRVILLLAYLEEPQCRELEYVE